MNEVFVLAKELVSELNELRPNQDNVIYHFGHIQQRK